MTYRYSPDPGYKMVLDLRAGPGFDPQNPPHLAVWLENQSFYHIKTLFVTDSMKAGRNFLSGPSNERGGRKPRKEAEARELDLEESLDAVSGATKNGSFDPADYILPTDQNESMPYRVLFEVNQPNDPSSKTEDQPSLVYEVEVDNYDPRTFQLLELIGFPEAEEVEEKRSGLFATPTNESSRPLTSSTAPFCKSNASPGNNGRNFSASRKNPGDENIHQVSWLHPQTVLIRISSSVRFSRGTAIASA